MFKAVGGGWKLGGSGSGKQMQFLPILMNGIESPQRNNITRVQFTGIMFWMCALCISAWEICDSRVIPACLSKTTGARGGLEIGFCGEWVVLCSSFSELDFWKLPNNCTRHWGVEWEVAQPCAALRYKTCRYQIFLTFSENGGITHKTEWPFPVGSGALENKQTEKSSLSKY